MIVVIVCASAQRSAANITVVIVVVVCASAYGSAANITVVIVVVVCAIAQRSTADITVVITVVVCARNALATSITVVVAIVVCASSQRRATNITVMVVVAICTSAHFSAATITVVIVVVVCALMNNEGEVLISCQVILVVIFNNVRRGNAHIAICADRCGRSSSGCLILITFACIVQNNFRTEDNAIFMGYSNIHSAVADHDTLASLKGGSCSLVPNSYVCVVSNNDLAVGSMDDGILTLVAIPVRSGCDLQLTAVHNNAAVVGQHVHVGLSAGSVAVDHHIGISQHNIAVGTDSSIGGSATVPLINVHQQLAFAGNGQVAGGVGVDGHTAAGVMCQGCITNYVDHNIFGGLFYANRIAATANVCAFLNSNSSITICRIGYHHIIVGICSNTHCANIIGLEVVCCAALNDLYCLCVNYEGNRRRCLLGDHKELVAVGICCVICSCAIGNLNINAIHIAGYTAYKCSCCAVIAAFIVQGNIGISSEHSTVFMDRSNLDRAVLDGNVLAEDGHVSLVDDRYFCAINGDIATGSVDQSKCVIIICKTVAASGNHTQLTAGDGDIAFLGPDVSVGLLGAAFTLDCNNSIVQNDVANRTDHTNVIAAVPHPSAHIQLSAVLTLNGEGAGCIRVDGYVSTTACVQFGIILYNNFHIFTAGNMNTAACKGICIFCTGRDIRTIQFNGRYTASGEVNFHLPVRCRAGRYCTGIICLEVESFAAFSRSDFVVADQNRSRCACRKSHYGKHTCNHADRNQQT